MKKIILLSVILIFLTVGCARFNPSDYVVPDNEEFITVRHLLKDQTSITMGKIQKTIDKSTVNELRIYASARASRMRLLPELESLLTKILKIV